MQKTLYFVSRVLASRGETMRQHLTSIVAIDRQGAIGCNNRLPWSIKSDLAFFRKTTLNNHVIMGRKTYESIGGCLPKRMNLVLSHNAVLFPETDTCMLARSVEQALAMASKCHDRESFVIGGAATYNEFAPFIDRYLITVVDHLAEDADAFLDESIRAEYAGWSCGEIASFPAERGRDEYSFRILEFVAPDAEYRQELRKAIAHQFLSKALNQRSSRQNRRSVTNPTGQTAFLF